MDSIQRETTGEKKSWMIVGKTGAGAVAIQKREDIRWKNSVLVIIIITTEHKTQTNKIFLAKMTLNYLQFHSSNYQML